MELNDLKPTWNEMNDNIQRLNANMLSSRKARGQRKAQISLKFPPIAELICASIGLLWNGSFFADKVAMWTQAPWLCVPSVLVHGFLILILAQAIQQLIAASSIDLTASLAVAQESLARFKAMQLRHTKATILIGTTIWFAFPMLLFQALAGPQVIAGLNPAWIFGNVFFGIACIVGSLVLAKKLAPNHRAVVALNNLLTGKSLTDIEKEVQAIHDYSS